MEIRIVTDKDAERISLTEGSFFAVPAEITVPAGADCAVLTVFPSLSDGAERAAKEGGDPLGDSAVRALACIADRLMNNAGYPGPAEIFRTVGFVSPEGYDREFSPPDGASIEEKTEDGVPAAAVFVGGREVSRASVNDIDAGDGVAEIYVETAPDCRNLGYATACVARLARTLDASGKRVRYVCENGNLPSVRVAEKAGFVPEYRSAAVVYYRPEGGTDPDGV